VNILGLDLSLTATGVAVVTTNGIDHRYRTELIKEPAKHTKWGDRDRIRWMIDQIALVIEAPLGPDGKWDLVVVEGLAYSRVTGHATTRAGLWWLVTENLSDNMPLAVMGPTGRAKYATGRGNASKADVMREVARRFPNFHGGEDEADALVLAAAAADHLGHPIAALPATHRAALDAVAWPDHTEETDR